jgi:hypothetical protein
VSARLEKYKTRRLIEYPYHIISGDQTQHYEAHRKDPEVAPGAGKSDHQNYFVLVEEGMSTFLFVFFFLFLSRSLTPCVCLSGCRWCCAGILHQGHIQCG